MADRLTGIEVFVTALRLGGLSAAARSMGMSPAMAGRHLADLEVRLGTTLVNRTTRRLSLTEAGADYLDRAERILADLREADAQASARSITTEGLLRVAAPATFGIMHLAGLAPAFQRRHPRVTVEFGFSDRYVDLLEERWDVAVRIGRLADSSLIARRLAPMRLAVCSSPAYLAERGMPRTVADLANHDCLGYTIVSGVGTSNWNFGPDGAIKVPVRGSLHANNGEGLVRAAAAGLGLVYGPRFIAAEALRDGALVEVILDVPLMDLGAVHVITHASRRPAAKTRAWIDYLVGVVPTMATDW